MDTVVCPHCGKDVKISQAFKHQIQEQVLAQEESKHKEEIERIKAETKQETEKRIKEEIELKIKDSQGEIAEQKARIEKLLQELLKSNEEKRLLKQKEEEQELEFQKKLSQERESLREEISKSEKERSGLELLEVKKQLDDTKKALEEAQRKAAQKSQQLQGEVMELNLEGELKKAFVLDEFLPVPKGIEGADIWQKVRNKHTQEAGSILWEIKRTKAWSKGWLPKLREDARKVNASVCILISDVLPEEVEFYDRQDGVWLCSYSHAVVLAKVLRDSLLQIAIAKSSASRKDDELQEIYDYIVSPDFRHRIEAHFESVKSLRDDLEIEKRAMERIWKKRQVQIERLDKSMSQMFGDLQGRIPKLAPIKSLEIEAEATDEENNF